MMTELTPERLAELKALEKAATPGPWVTRFDGAVYREVVRGEVPVCEHASREEAALIAALRNAASALIAAAEERDELRKELRKCTINKDELWKVVRDDAEKLRKSKADGEDVVQMLVERDKVADAALADAATFRALLVRAGEAMERRKAFKEEAYSNKDVFDCAVATIDFEFDLLFAEIRRATQGETL